MSSKAAFVKEAADVLSISESRIKKCLEMVAKKFKDVDEKVLIQVLKEHYEELKDTYDELLVNFPPEVQEMLVKDIPVKSILNFCASSRSFLHICDSDYLWRTLLLRDYGVNYRDQDPKRTYKLLYFLNNVIKKAGKKNGRGIPESSADIIALAIYELVEKGIYNTPKRTDYIIRENSAAHGKKTTLLRDNIQKDLLYLYLKGKKPPTDYRIVLTHFWGSKGLIGAHPKHEGNIVEYPLRDLIVPFGWDEMSEMILNPDISEELYDLIGKVANIASITLDSQVIETIEERFEQIRENFFKDDKNLQMWMVSLSCFSIQTGNIIATLSSIFGRAEKHASTLENQAILKKYKNLIILLEGYIQELKSMIGL